MYAHLRWGQDASKVWHLAPCMVITGLDLIDHSCTDFDTYIRFTDDVVTEPPAKGNVCPVCRSVMVRMIVESKT